MRERMTTALDTAGLLLVAAGAGAGVYRWLGWAALAVSGGVILAGSWLASGSGRKGGKT
ncbi:hypothetical protein [Streptomyces ipomoeae]|uniref:hypothetical protein n=1 Tax=Streptomyces ipomoeae TaxID=103232 RepID=UPI0029A17D0F|nr:hypothetical protein [Streptomyces ipomoeae]MDX2692950.1 hypothetical protein [Streptomyces ipomoeae]MDX2840682.1 hypothetical protein [Streptomyces ipomoeae]